MSTISNDTYIDALGMTIEDLAQVEDLENFYESLFEGLSEDEIDDLKDSIETEFDSLDQSFYTYENQLNDIMNSSKASEEEIYLAEYYLEQLHTLKTVIDDFSSQWGDALDVFESKTIDVTDGSDYIFSVPEDAESGFEYVIETPESSEDSSNDLFESNESDLEDVNFDGVVDGADATYDNQTITIELEEGDTLEWRSTDPETGDTRLYILKADGTEIYVTIENLTTNSDLDIILSGATGGLTEDYLSSFPEDLLKSFYDSKDHHDLGISIYDFMYNDGQSGVSTGGLTDSNLNLAEMGVKEITLAPSEEDFAAESTITISSQDDVAETLNFVFDDSHDVEFGYTENGDLKIMVTNEDGQTVTYILEDMVYDSEDSEVQDQIQIQGGKLNEDNVNLLYAASQAKAWMQNQFDSWYGGNQDQEQAPSLLDIIYINGSSDNLSTEIENGTLFGGPLSGMDFSLSKEFIFDDLSQNNTPNFGKSKNQNQSKTSFSNLFDFDGKSRSKK